MRILIIEDETPAAKRLEKMILELDPTAEIVGKIESIEDALLWFESQPKPDLAFCDIHLADGSCFEIFRNIELPCPVIFATAYDQYALQAFKVNAIDYLLKPIKAEELAVALQRYRDRTAPPAIETVNKLAEALGIAPIKEQRLLIKMGQSIKVLPFTEVAYFYTQDKISFAVAHNGRRFPLDFSMEKLEDMVPSQKFFRINRQFIVNIEAIKAMHAYSKSRVKIELTPHTDHDTIVSTERSARFKKWLEG